MVIFEGVAVAAIKDSNGDVLTFGAIAEGDSWVRSGDSIIGAAPAGGWVDDGTNVRLATATRKVGIGTAAPNAILEVRGEPSGNVGGFPSGSLHVTSLSAVQFRNAVITGHNLFNGNTQLWYLGSSSSSNDDITLINRQNAALSLSTNNTQRMIILAGGEIGVGGASPDPSAILDVQSTTKGVLLPLMTTAQINAIGSPSGGLLAFDKTKDLLRIKKVDDWCYIPCGIITGQFSHAVSQKPSVTTPVSLAFDTNDITLEGIGHSTTVKPEEFTAKIKKSYTFMLAPQWERTTSGGTRTIDFFMQISTDGGTVFADVANSNVKVVAGSADSNVIPLMATIALNVNDIVRFQMRISDTGDGLGTVFTAAEVGPPTIPATPAQILTIFSGD